MELTFRLNFSW